LRLVVDLDPGEGIEWDFVQDTALNCVSSSRAKA
jgi:DNA primase